jgi:hypothetical protein
MFNWFRRRRKPDTPTVLQKTIGEVDCRSSVLLFADPSYIFSGVRVEAIPPRRYPIEASIIQYPEGGMRIAKIGLQIRNGIADSTIELGSIAVDSALIVIADEETIQNHWQEVGPDRIGRTGPIGEHRQVAKIIGDRFGIAWRTVDGFHSQFDEPISVELEERIIAFLKTIPKYADYPFMYFRMKTSNSLDRVYEVKEERSYATVALDPSGDASVLALTTGFGDGTYPVLGLMKNGLLQSIEIEFIGPKQDEILDAFPVLRY